ncbi:hypothetical protein CWB85_19680 [Pseudoalteromonas sp. S1727]|uniref:hypothetical protein n=1 Tax=Pseudoalteromonas sp. S1727 TaxID=2066514 RepID=UPI001109FD67|nr:hypothetical protein [Pseudoalteromonas sp. S1727]TMN67272.1 hypothetical protein CWB85_19680 [Pseudoalteromonas sp. S1727]
MKKLLLAVLCIAMAFYFFIPTKITGDVYVLTNGKATIAMPMVEIKAYDYDDFKQHLADVKHYSAINCSAVPTKNEIDKLAIKVLKQGPSYREEYKKAKQSFDQCSLNILLFDKLNLSALARTTTDKNGHFSMSLNRNNVVLIAQSERKVLRNTEYYTWIKVVKMGVGFSEKADLDNSTDKSDTLLHNINI